MKTTRMIAIAVLLFGTLNSEAQDVTSVKAKRKTKNYYIDVHHLGAGKVTAMDVALAHTRDLAVEKRYGVSFLEYWVDEAHGNVYCLSSTTDPLRITKTHKAAHGLLPDEIYSVVAGQASNPVEGKSFFLDIHELGRDKVTAKDVEDAHQKDLAVQGQHGVNFINYWVNEKKGSILCLSQAPDAEAVSKVHSNAHGLVPVWVKKVVKGQ
jgi:uncharacterized protein Usg